MSGFSAAPFRDTVGDLMYERGWTQRDLANAVGVDSAHICRLLKRGTSMRATPQLIARIASALDVEPEFFAEYREWCVLEAVRTNPSLRERLFARVVAPIAAHPTQT